MNKIGAFQNDITPTCEVYLAGTAELRKTSQVQSRLYASAVVVDDSNMRLVFISLDLLWLNDAICHELRERVAEAAGTHPDRVMICCTHTHNGPIMSRLVPQVSPDEAVVAEIKDKIVETGRSAASQLAEATMCCTQDTVARSFNRRTIIEGEKVRMGASSDDPPITGAEGPADQELLTVWFKDVCDKPIAVLVNYAAHPNHWCFETAITAEFPGEIRATVQHGLGGDIPLLYLQGACGNTDIKDYAGLQYANDYDHLENTAEAGREIGKKVLEMMADSACLSEINITLSHEKRIIEAPARHCGRADMSLEEARTFLLAHTDEAPEPYHGYDPELWKRYWAESVVYLEGTEPFRKTYPLEISLYRLGELVIVTNPAELFVEYQLDVKRGSPFPNTMVVELANGYCGYIPTGAAMRNGGYETRLAFSSFLAPEAGALWVENVVNMLSVQSARDLK